jgi:hypothetical protein
VTRRSPSWSAPASGARSAGARSATSSPGAIRRFIEASRRIHEEHYGPQRRIDLAEALALVG